MTPAEELRTAMARLRCDHDFSFVERGCGKCGVDTRPVVDELAEPLAVLFEREARRVVPFSCVVDVARAINGGAQ